MFDFAPVGLVVAISGIAFVTLIGWRLLPARFRQAPETDSMAEGLYSAELKVGKLPDDKDLTLGDLYPVADEKMSRSSDWCAMAAASEGLPAGN
jgi:hypothetical protein